MAGCCRSCVPSRVAVFDSWAFEAPGSFSATWPLAAVAALPSLLLGRAAGGLFLHGDFSAWVHALKSLFFAQKKHSERFRMIRNRSERCGQHSHEVSCCE